jgi:hypothetical protein
VDERDYYEKNVDQFMRNIIIDVVKGFVERYGSKEISYQKLALTARLKGMILENIVEWGIELTAIEFLGLAEIPTLY